MKTTKFLCEMTTNEQIEARTHDLAVQKELLERAGDLAPAVREWIAQTERALAMLAA